MLKEIELPQRAAKSGMGRRRQNGYALRPGPAVAYDKKQTYPYCCVLWRTIERVTPLAFKACLNGSSRQRSNSREGLTTMMDRHSSVGTCMRVKRVWQNRIRGGFSEFCMELGFSPRLRFFRISKEMRKDRNRLAAAANSNSAWRIPLLPASEPAHSGPHLSKTRRNPGKPCELRQCPVAVPALERDPASKLDNKG